MGISSAEGWRVGEETGDGRKDGWGIYWFVVERWWWGRTFLVEGRMERVVCVVVGSWFSDYVDGWEGLEGFRVQPAEGGPLRLSNEHPWSWRDREVGNSRGSFPFPTCRSKFDSFHRKPQS